MAEAIGVAAGCLAFAQAAFQSSITLYQTVQSFQSHSQRVRDLSDELTALCGVLKSLASTTTDLPDVDFSALTFPLQRCQNACDDFKKDLLKYSSRSKDRTSFRDWAKLQYMGDDIDGFRRLLSSYKMTISVALTDATLKKSSVTAENIKDYTKLLDTTRTDLEDQLESINTKLDRIGDTVASSQADALKVKAIKDERLSTEKSLQICAQLSDHITQLQLAAAAAPHSSSAAGGDFTFPEQLTNEGLQKCKNQLAETARKLAQHEQILFDRLLNHTRGAMTSEDERHELSRLRDEWESTRQGMKICSEAHDNLRENVSTIDNYAVGDAVQLMVSTDTRTVNGRNRGLGWRSRQVGGHIDPESFRQMMKSLEVMDLQPRAPDQNAPANDSAQASAGAEQTSRFQSQYGKGFNLKSTSSR